VVLPGHEEITADTEHLFDLVDVDKVGQEEPGPHVDRLVVNYRRAQQSGIVSIPPARAIAGVSTYSSAATTLHFKRLATAPRGIRQARTEMIDCASMSMRETLRCPVPKLYLFAAHSEFSAATALLISQPPSTKL
jgi:hypothetical protein